MKNMKSVVNLSFSTGLVGLFAGFSIKLLAAALIGSIVLWMAGKYFRKARLKHQAIYTMTHRAIRF
jgi:hypothetical protein